MMNRIVSDAELQCQLVDRESSLVQPHDLVFVFVAQFRLVAGTDCDAGPPQMVLHRSAVDAKVSGQASQ